jgi:formylglycine-generating enzyme required for sulfatase activity
MLRLAVALALLLPAHTASAQCLGDLNGDLKVSGADIGILLGEWGTAGGMTGADIDGNGTVSGSDLGAMLGAWGDCPVTVPSWATLVEARPDPAVVTNPELRTAIEATGLAWRVRDKGAQIEMVLIPPGTFRRGCIMGSNQYECSYSEWPTHPVTLTNAFYIGRYEVTQSQWQATMGSNPSHFHGQSDSASRPVERVSWPSVQGYLSATGLRLATEAEWEYACRAGTQTPFYNGSTDDSTLATLAWCWPSNQTHPVGGKAANGFGLHDMLGNVSEWVNDWFGEYSSSPLTNPTGPASSLHRVIRGGSWGGPTYFVRSSRRGGALPGHAASDLGFRVVKNP